MSLPGNYSSYVSLRGPHSLKSTGTARENLIVLSFFKPSVILLTLLLLLTEDSINVLFFQLLILQKLCLHLEQK